MEINTGTTETQLDELNAAYRELVRLQETVSRDAQAQRALPTSPHQSDLITTMRETNGAQIRLLNLTITDWGTDWITALQADIALDLARGVNRAAAIRDGS